MKVCKSCGTDNPEEFYPTQGTLYCRPCFGTRYIEPGRERLFQAKLARGKCADCGLEVTKENAVCFDWDHLGDKRWNVSRMMTCSLANFNREIAKCELVCSNDHRIRTKARGRQWAKGGRPTKARASPSAPPPTPPSSSE